MTIEITDLSFTFLDSDEKDISVFKSFSLSLENSKIIAIVGPSGCGKSTLLRLIAGLLEPDSGTVLVDENPANQRREEGYFGLVFQSSDLLPWRTVARNVRLPFELQGKAAEKKNVQQIISRVGLSSWIDSYPYQLSGGMQQRAALARALVAVPKVLLLDEPFSHLDELLRFELLFHVQNHAIINKTTAVLVTHDLSEAVIFADIVYVLSDRPVRNAARIEIPLQQPRSLDTANENKFHELVSRVRLSLKKQKMNV